MNKTILIIVCGGTGSGKTTIASEIKKILPKKFKTQIVSMDSFYKKREYMDQDIYFKHNFDHPNAFDWPLMLVSIQSMLEHKPTMIPIYDYSKSERTNKTELIPASDVIIFEGILSLYDQKINKLASIKIFVDTPDDERFIRRLLRDKKERGRSDDNIIGQ
jgi:uridine kinase